MTLEEGIKEIGRMAARLDRETKRAEFFNAHLLLKAVQERSQGPFSTAELAKMGHPYARRHPVSDLDPGVVNVQSGTFAASWRMIPVRVGDDTAYEIVNVDQPVATFLEEGTDRMVPRPVLEKATAEMQDRIQANFRSAIERALR